MPSERSCPTCGGPLPPDAPEGTCPKCLLAAGFESADGGAAGGMLEMAEVARQFPELEIIEELGRGGMGVVYKARQKRLDRFVALKVLPREIANSAPDAARFEDRFTREARALARLSHPNIVAVHEFGERDGMYFFLMEYVDGANLRQTMRAGRLSPTEALAIVPQICEALQFAHEQGVVHRDIKPENVLLDLKGRVKIADFGLAKLVTRAADDLTLTQQGLVMGTPHYMAPEQLEKPSEVDHRADIYSLGVVLYEMLTGELPIGRFAAPSEKVRMDVRLDEIVLRSLEKDADRRYQAVSEVKTGIGEVDLSAGAGVAVAPDPVRPNSRSSRLAFWGLMLPLVAMVLAVVIGLVGTLFRQQGGMNPSGPTMSILMFPVGVLGLAILVGIVLSVAGIVQIKHSGGKLSGMGLAIAGLLVPLLCCLPGVFVPFMWLSTAGSPRLPSVPVPYDQIVPVEPIRPESVDASSIDVLGEVRVELELDEESAALVQTAQPFTLECGPSSQALPQLVYPLAHFQVGGPETIVLVEPGLITVRSPETIRLPVPAGWKFRVDRVQIEGAATVNVDDQTFPPEGPPEGTNAAEFSARLHGRTFDARSIESFRVQYRDSEARVTIEGALLLADTEADEPR